MAVDTVFNHEMRPVFVDQPREVLRRLKAPHSEDWWRVCVGDTGVVMTIPEYLYQETYKDVQGLIKDVLNKSQLSMYKRDPKRLGIVIEQTAVKIIELARKDME